MMTSGIQARAGGLAMVAAIALLGIGCAQDRPGQRAGKTGAKGKGAQVAKAENRHDGWWCDEHGIPEAECSMCNGKVAAESKGKGDWCDKHDRARSQCFLCEPKLREKYAALHRAKLGKEPPPTEDQEMEKDGEKK